MRNFTNTASVNSIAPASPQIIVNSPQSLSEEMAETAASVGSKRSSGVTMSTHIKAPVEVCFDLVTKQLEEAPRWDPTIRWVVPISREYIGVGSKSRVTFDLAGSIEEAVVVVRSFVPNRVLMWTSNHSSQLQEEWHFGRASDGTFVMVTLNYNPYGGLLKHLARWMRMRSQVKPTVSEMLRRLKMAAELPIPKYY